MEKLFAKPREAAEALGIGRSKTYALIASGVLPSVRIGKSVRVPIAALRQWAETQVKMAEAGAGMNGTGG
jgi:excisionase family DNA binding protein